MALGCATQPWSGSVPPARLRARRDAPVSPGCWGRHPGRAGKGPGVPRLLQGFDPGLGNVPTSFSTAPGCCCALDKEILTPSLPLSPSPSLSPPDRGGPDGCIGVPRYWGAKEQGCPPPMGQELAHIALTHSLPPQSPAKRSVSNPQPGSLCAYAPLRVCTSNICFSFCKNTFVLVYLFLLKVPPLLSISWPAAGPARLGGSPCTPGGVPSSVGVPWRHLPSFLGTLWQGSIDVSGCEAIPGTSPSHFMVEAEIKR